MSSATKSRRPGNEGWRQSSGKEVASFPGPGTRLGKKLRIVVLKLPTLISETPKPPYQHCACTLFYIWCCPPPPPPLNNVKYLVCNTWRVDGCTHVCLLLWASLIIPRLPPSSPGSLGFSLGLRNCCTQDFIVCTCAGPCVPMGPAVGGLV